MEIPLLWAGRLGAVGERLQRQGTGGHQTSPAPAAEPPSCRGEAATDGVGRGPGAQLHDWYLLPIAALRERTLQKGGQGLISYQRT